MSEPEMAREDGAIPPLREPWIDPESIELKNRRLVRNVLGIFFIVAAMAVCYQFGAEKGRSTVAVDNATLSPDETVFSNTTSQDKTIDFSLFWKVWNVLKDKYVDGDKLDSRKLFYGSIKGMLAAAGDPYTTFFDPEDQKSFEEDMAGKFEGIGAEMGIRDEILTVIAPLDDTPSQKAGLRPNDRILKVDGETTTNLGLEEAVSKIRGPKGTEVRLTIYREGEDESREVTVLRDVINVKSVKVEFRNNDEIAILRVGRFGDTTEKEFREAAVSVARTAPRGLVLDLRSNPGGLLHTAVDMASLMLPAGQTVVIEENGKGDRKTEKASGGDVLSGISTVVLIDEGSASASEILAGALREDRKNVTLVGKKSYGKGSVQELIPVGKDMSVKVTVARWLTPDGNQINEKGITPDFEVDLTVDDFKAGRDPQMDKAIDLLLGNGA
ncbi:MAG: S41 family peptidase [Candidatus Moranbacteria bacterium]|nr:S41 family peptidase [Candidatus Moranbacteria bacterium]